MKKKLIIGIVGIVVALALLTPNAPEGSETKDVGASKVTVQEVATPPSGIVEQKEEVPEVCKDLKGAQDYIADFESRLVESEGKDYLMSDECRAFEKAFWSSFWQEHNDCPICEKNGYYN